MVDRRRQRKFTPALRLHWLTPFYDTAIRLFTREKKWRGRLLELLDPQPDDRILDVGCGTGSLAILIKQEFPGCQVVGIDPDERVLRIARRKAELAGVSIDWRTGFAEDLSPERESFAWIVSTLVLHQTSLESKKTLLRHCRHLLSEEGKLLIADYGIQESWAMRFLFRLVVQTVDGRTDTQPNADGFILDFLRQSDFRDSGVDCCFPTLTGALSIFRATR